MDLSLHFAYWPLLFITIPVWVFFVLYRWYWYKPVTYRYSLISSFMEHGAPVVSWRPALFFLLRSITTFVLAVLIARPQLVDKRIMVPVLGIDIMMVLDVSGSMNCFDDLKDRRSRMEGAKTEAQRFIAAREHDAVGLVLFANEVISRVPLTTDKKILIDIIHDLHLGDLDPRGTLLSTALSLACQRLKNSKARSKIIILLTDGQPSDNDIDSAIAISLPKEYSIKVYTIGVGNEQGGYFEHPLFGLQQAEIGLNVALLQKIAQETGGKFFEARKPAELKKIYDEINQLEKTEHEVSMYYHYQELWWPFLILALILASMELLISLWWVRL